jgi:formylmethanofuran dehydrogenase subunit C
MEWIFQSRQKIAERVDASPLLPSRLAAMSIDDVLNLKLKSFAASKEFAVKDLFELHWNSGQASEVDSHQVVLRGDCSHLDRVGFEMDSGVILVEGSIGDQVAFGMRDGTIIVGGNCGNELCCGMRDGRVLVRGSAGNRVAGPVPGAKSGMRGGDCIIAGSCGDRVAERMRRGTLVVGGSCGDHGASFMIAGTLLLLGEIGAGWGCGMQRGSIIVTDSVQMDDLTFNAELTIAREFELSYLPILWRHIRETWNSQLALFTGITTQADYAESVLDFTDKIPRGRWCRRQLGDRSYEGRGEVLQLTKESRRC